MIAWAAKRGMRLWACVNSVPNGFQQPMWTMRDVLVCVVVCGALVSGGYLLINADDAWDEDYILRAAGFGAGACVAFGIAVAALCALWKLKTPVRSAWRGLSLCAFGARLRISARLPSMSDLGLNRPLCGWRGAAYGAFMGYAMWLMASFALFLFMERVGVEVSGVRLDLDRDGVWLVAYVLFAGVIFPAFEELTFRGMLLGALLRVMPVAAAVAVSAAAFAAMHFSISAMPIYFGSGLYFGYLFIRTGSLWPCIGAHAAHNSLIVLLLFLLE